MQKLLTKGRSNSLKFTLSIVRITSWLILISVLSLISLKAHAELEQYQFRSEYLSGKDPIESDFKLYERYFCGIEKFVNDTSGLKWISRLNWKRFLNRLDDSYEFVSILTVDGTQQYGQLTVRGLDAALYFNFENNAYTAVIEIDEEIYSYLNFRMCKGRLCVETTDADGAKYQNDNRFLASSWNSGLKAISYMGCYSKEDLVAFGARETYCSPVQVSKMVDSLRIYYDLKRFWTWQKTFSTSERIDRDYRNTVVLPTLARLKLLKNEWSNTDSCAPIDLVRTTQMTATRRSEIPLKF